jgi:hypothetical protein
VARLLTFLLVAAAVVTSGASQPQEVTDVRGTIEAVNPRAGWYGIVPDNDRGTRYAPDRLPDDFRKDGLRVVFSGRVGPVDPGARSWGIPLTLTKIERETVAKLEVRSLKLEVKSGSPKLEVSPEVRSWK